MEKDQPGNWEARRPESRTLTAQREYITLMLGRRESERPIVTMKRNNSRGVKGPYCYHALYSEEESRLSDEDHYGRRSPVDALCTVITSYSIHYTKLYEMYSFFLSMKRGSGNPCQFSSNAGRNNFV